MLKTLSTLGQLGGGNGSITITDGGNTTINNVTNITITPSKAKGSGSNVTVSLGIYEAVGNGVPLANSFTTIINQGDSSLTNGNGSLVFIGPANVALNIRGFLMPAPNATPYSIYMRAMPVAQAFGTVSFGLIVYNNVSTKLIIHHQQTNSNTSTITRTFQSFNSPTSFGSTIESVVQWTYSPWWRLDVLASGIITPYYSPNGWDWGPGQSTNAAAFLSTITHIGLGYQCQNSNGVFMINAFQTTPPA